MLNKPIEGTAIRRRIGDSTVLDLSKNIEATAQEYNVYSGDDGALIFIPKKDNPWLDSEFVATHTFPQKESFGGPLVGNEIPEK